MPRLLDRKEVALMIKSLDGWKRDGDFLTKTFEFGEFMDGIEFVNDVARVAEKLEHHPDISVRYTTVKLSVQTHDEGGITNRDVRLARAIDRMPPGLRK